MNVTKVDILIGELIRSFQALELLLFGVKNQGLEKSDCLLELSNFIDFTLGKKINNLKKDDIFDDDFITVLTYIKDKRNLIVHNLCDEYDFAKSEDIEKAEKYLEETKSDVETIKDVLVAFLKCENCKQ